MKFSLIDAITEFEPGRRIVAVKNLSRAEEYLADHFPGFPVMPGVMMLETLVQASAWLLRASQDFRYSTIILHEAKALRFKSFVSPGDRLIVTSELTKHDDVSCTLKASGKVGENEVVSARLVLRQMNLAASDEKFRSIDERMTEHFRNAWKELQLVSDSVRPA